MTGFWGCFFSFFSVDRQSLHVYMLAAGSNFVIKHERDESKCLLFNNERTNELINDAKNDGPKFQAKQKSSPTNNQTKKLEEKVYARDCWHGALFIIGENLPLLLLPLPGRRHALSASSPEPRYGGCQAAWRDDLRGQATTALIAKLHTIRPSVLCSGDAPRRFVKTKKKKKKKKGFHHRAEDRQPRCVVF